jgi:hypothetical protein
MFYLKNYSMKKWMTSAILFTAVVFTFALTGCEKSDDTPEPTEENPILFDGNQIGDGDQEFEVIGNHTLEKGTYVLKGWVYVTANSTLTIEPGTVIRGDKATKAALIVEPGGKLIAEGTSAEPIVFTSNQPKGQRKPGDWGGVIICGRAVNNKAAMIIEGGPRTTHGGNNDADNSGIISYVRIEFAGFPFKPDQEINGLTLGSVGSGTRIDHVQVSYTNDDSFEFFGGSVNAKYLVAYHGWDDDFDTDNGFSGKLQFLLGIRNPRIADTSVSNGFESDNDADASTRAPFTSAVFSNVTIIGPIGQDAAFANSDTYINGGSFYPDNGSKLGIFHSAIQIRRNSRMNLFNSVAVGYPVGILLENDKGGTVQTWATNGNLKISNVYLAGTTILGSDKNKSYLDQLSTNATTLDPSQESFSATYFKTATLGNMSYPTIAALSLKQPNSLESNPNFGPMTGSPLTGKTGLFSDALVQNSFFTQVDYIGAFKSDADADNWMKDWTELDPNNAEY